VISKMRATVFQPDAPSLQHFTKALIPPPAFSGIVMTGIPGHPIEDVTLKDCSISFVGGFQDDGSSLHPPEDEAMYPEHFYFGVLPASCAYLRHINGVRFENVALALQNPDPRPPVVREDVEGFVMD